MRNEKLTIIVPCYNESEALPFLYREVASVADSMECTCELLLINDGSRDDTLRVMKELSERDVRVKYLSFARNFGKEAALYAGLCNAKGDYVAVMDADLQDPPSLLPRMLEILRSGEYDTVATRRQDRKGEPPVRSWFAHKFYSTMRRLSDADMVDGARDFRLMTRKVVDAVVAMGEYNRFSKGLFGWVGFRTCWLSYENVERVAGQTKWSFWGLFRYAVDGIINFSKTPLSVASWFGMGMTAFSFIALIYIVLRRLIFGDPVAGWASTICVIIFVGGIQLFCLGIIGQYIARIFMETKNRPHYIASESNLDDAEMIR
ncbi:MAG: glycosyltransferase family 2 protein [Clostridia bacterium]|nr:glycosyltransferase family 2 protein [Clostridia bacterium]